MPECLYLPVCFHSRHLPLHPKPCLQRPSLAGLPSNLLQASFSIKGVSYEAFIADAAKAQAFRAQFAAEVASQPALASIGITADNVAVGFSKGNGSSSGRRRMHEAMDGQGGSVSRRGLLQSAAAAELLVAITIGPFPRGASKAQAEAAVDQVVANPSATFSSGFTRAFGVTGITGSRIGAQVRALSY